MPTWAHEAPPVNSSADFRNAEHIPGQTEVCLFENSNTNRVDILNLEVDTVFGQCNVKSYQIYRYRKIPNISPSMYNPLQM